MECRNRHCDFYDLVGSERSCRRGKDPNSCGDSRAWMDGIMYVWDECLDEEYDSEEAEQRAWEREMSRMIRD